MALETQNINNPLNAHQHNVDVNSLKESLKAYGERSEDKKQEKTELKIEEVIHQLVSANLPVAEMEAMLAVLPLEKRLLIQNMILAEQRQQISLMSQEQYKQFLNAKFLSGAPTNLGEMASSMVSDTSELYRKAQEEIVKTNPENPLDHEKEEIRIDKKQAVVAAQSSEQQTKKLADELSHVPEQVMV